MHRLDYILREEGQTMTIQEATPYTSKMFQRNASYKNIRKSTRFISNGFADTHHQFDGDNSFRKTI